MWKSDGILIEFFNANGCNVIFRNEISIDVFNFRLKTQKSMDEFKKIVALSFVKAYKDNPLSTSKTALSKKISEVITEKEFGEPDERHYKSLVNYYDYFFKEGKRQEPTEAMINKLLGFLNYDSLDQFIKNQPFDKSYLQSVPFVNNTEISSSKEVSSNNENDKQETLINTPSGKKRTIWNRLKRKITVTITVSITFLFLFYFGLSRFSENCMEWREDHYVQVKCTRENKPQIAYDENLLYGFKKVQNDTVQFFFGENATPLYWYYRKGNQVELYTMNGVHPVMGTKLKPITETIVRNYIYQE